MFIKKEPLIFSSPGSQSIWKIITVSLWLFYSSLYLFIHSPSQTPPPSTSQSPQRLERSGPPSSPSQKFFYSFVVIIIIIIVIIIIIYFGHFQRLLLKLCLRVRRKKIVDGPETDTKKELSREQKFQTEMSNMTRIRVNCLNGPFSNSKHRITRGFNHREA